MKEINIEIKDKTLIAIGGNEFGYDTYKKYEKEINEELEKGNKVEIIFPETIELIIPSFPQGFLKEIKDNYKLGEVIISGGKDQVAKSDFDMAIREEERYEGR